MNSPRITTSLQKTKDAKKRTAPNGTVLFLFIRLTAFDYRTFSAEGNADFDNRMDAGTLHLGIVFLFVYLSEGSVRQRIQIYARIVGMLEFKQEAGDTAYQGRQLNIKSPEAGFPVGTYLIAAAENGA